MRGYLPLIQKVSSTHIHGLTVYVKEGLPFAWDLSLENSGDSLCFRQTLLHSLSYFFCLYPSPSSALCMVFYSISSNIRFFKVLILFHLTSNIRFSQSTHLLRGVLRPNERQCMVWVPKLGLGKKQCFLFCFVLFCFY